MQDLQLRCQEAGEEQEQYCESQRCDTSARMGKASEGDATMGNTSAVVDRASGGETIENTPGKLNPGRGKL